MGGFFHHLAVLLFLPEKVKSALGVLDVLNAHVDALGQDPTLAEGLVDNDTETVWCNVEDSA